MDVKTLAIETSSREGSVAAVEDGVLLEERLFAHGLRHAAGIIPMLDDVCRSRGWKPAEIGRVDVSAGTGSFTGLRIGITLAKAFALATGAKLVAVPSLRVLVENAPADAKHVIIALDAKRGQVFSARFERGETLADGTIDWIEREPVQLVTLAEMIARSPRPVHLLGEGLPYHQQAIDPADAGVIVTDESVWRPRASVVARLGQRLADRGEYADPYTLTPIYIRMAEAEEKYLAAKGGDGVMS